MNRISLHREVNGNIRYYRLLIYPALFNQYLLVREYGAIKNKKPTGTIREYFFHLEDLNQRIESICLLKGNRGYHKKIID